jgi:hypothetical protein
LFSLFSQEADGMLAAAGSDVDSSGVVLDGRLDGWMKYG